MARSIWDPIKLIGKFSSSAGDRDLDVHRRCRDARGQHRRQRRLPANDFANAFPRWINFKTGGLITGILGILIQPWRLLADPSGYIFNWLLGYSGAGLDRRRAHRRLLDRSTATLALEDLYLTDGRYGALELAGMSAQRSPAARWRGVACSMPPLRPLYDYAWFVGFAVAAIVYLVMHRFSGNRQPA